MRHRIPTVLATHTWDLPVRLVWQMSGLMLLGMALLKLGVLTAARSSGFYLRLALGGLGAGSLVVLAAVAASVAGEWDLVDYALVSQPLEYVGNAVVALGWVGVVAGLCRRGWTLGPVAAVGRMALSNYLAQTVICTSIFYGHGLGLFGRVDRTGQLAVVVAIWAVELAGSALWLRAFSAGPVEWLVRWAMAGERPPLRRPSPAIASA
jgi:uncharacterized protein